MTDKEMMKQIAEELQRLRDWSESVAVLMSKYRTVDREGNPLPWRQDLNDLQHLPEYRDLMESRDLELAQLIDGEEFESAPIRAVWGKYCQSRNRKDT
jgi:hypothetical protein